MVNFAAYHSHGKNRKLNNEVSQVSQQIFGKI
jgi:hypothetical protein